MSIDDKETCREMAERVRQGSFFNPRDVILMLRIIKRLDVSGDRLKQEFAKMALSLEEHYKERLRVMQ